jgi:long-chain fatty acid transport protein
MYKVLTSLAAGTVLFTSLAVASNGTLLIGSGAKSRAMGGVGTATFVGTESALKNPAMLTFNDGDQMSLSNTFIYETATLQADSGISEDYGKDVMLVPSFGYLKNFSKHMVVAIHGAGIGGGAVSYRDNANTNFVKFQADQSFIDTAFAFAYKKDNLSYGASLILNHSLFEVSVSGTTTEYDPSVSFGFQ